MTADPVRAAGGVLWRPATGGGIEICVVHRPRLRDWSLPKGKLDGDEHPLVGAVREVFEETGVRGHPQLRLPEVSYVMANGVPKTVDFWLMRADDAPAAPITDTDEVDGLAWLPPAAAAERLSYPDDRRLVEYVAGLPPITALTLLVRHAHAGERKAWRGNDNLRPLDELGRVQADQLAVVLALFEPKRLYAATPLRCQQTLQPLADKLGRPIVVDSAFAEPGDLAELPAKVQIALARLAELRTGETAVICSQGKVIPPLLAALTGAADPEQYKTPKGGGWLLTWSGDRLVGLSRL
ncbi:MAG TPA: NUDIX hydrolase [Actinoplanes sp.]|nr:NUDIX hydrolase [Actinoplanes sp.]